MDWSKCMIHNSMKIFHKGSKQAKVDKKSSLFGCIIEILHKISIKVGYFNYQFELFSHPNIE